MSSTFDGISVIDGIGLLLVLGIGIAGAFKGAVRYIVGLAAVMAGVSLAVTHGQQLGAETWPFVESSGNPEQVGGLVGGAVLFVAALLTGAIIAKLLRKALEEVSLGGLDRFLGFVFGAARGALFTMVLVFMAKAVGSGMLDEDVNGSYSLAFTREVAVAARPWIPEANRQLVDDTLQLKSEPALR
jgi:uncharacterized membrane protein required for colicin V production